MEVKKIVEGMTAVEVAEVIDSNFKNQNKILEEDIATQNSVIGVSEYKDFSEAEAVSVGDVRKYNGFLYECVEATTGAFDASKWKKSSFKAETEKKLSELGSEVNNKAESLNLVNPFKCVRGKYLNTNGVLNKAETELYAVSDFIKVQESNIASNAAIYNGTTIASWAAYDKDGGFIRSSNETNKYTFSGEDYYVRFTFYGEDFIAVYGDEIGIYVPYGETRFSSEIPTIKKGVDDIKKNIDLIEESVNLVKSELSTKITSVNLVNPKLIERGKYISGNGSIAKSNSDDYFISDYIAIEGNNISSNAVVSPNTDISSWSVYDKNKTFIRSSNTSSKYIYMLGDSYVRFTFYKVEAMANYGDTLFDFSKYGETEYSTKIPNILNDVSSLQDKMLPIEKETSNEIEEEIIIRSEEGQDIVKVGLKGLFAKGFYTLDGGQFFSNSEDFLKLAFNKWLCIGDSTTHGFVSDYGFAKGGGFYVQNVSTPLFLSRLTGMNVINAGHGSWNCKEWWQYIAKDIDYSDIDLVTIEMGYNRGFTDTLEQDVNQYSNYNDYADTDTGCYCKIIEYIKEQNKDVFIVLVISSHITETSTVAKVVGQIAEKYSLPIIRLYKKDIINLDDDRLHGYLNAESTSLDYIHFNALGYLYKAELLWYYMKDVIRDNLVEVKNKLSARWCNADNYLWGYTPDNKIILSEMTYKSNR